MTVVIITGGIDLSVGSVVGLAGMIVGMLMTSGTPPLVAAIIAVIACFVVGVGNGIMIHEGGIAPFIATLGSMTMVRGLVQLLTNARTISGLPEAFLRFGNADYFGVPSQFWVWAILAVILTMMLNRTRFGRNAYGIGSSPEVARLSGIGLRANLYFAYGISGLLAGCRSDGASADGGGDGRKPFRTICNCSSGDWGCQSQRSAGYHHGLRPWCTDHDDHRKWRKPLRDRRLYAPDCDRGAHCSCGLDRPDSKRENGIINHGHGSRALCACRPVCPVLKVMLKLGIRAIAPSQKAALRLGEPGEVAEAVVWLCSDAASFTTGHARVIDGDTSQNRRHDRARPHGQGNL